MVMRFPFVSRIYGHPVFVKTVLAATLSTVVFFGIALTWYVTQALLFLQNQQSEQQKRLAINEQRIAERTKIACKIAVDREVSEVSTAARLSTDIALVLAGTHGATALQERGANDAKEALKVREAQSRHIRSEAKCK